MNRVRLFSSLVFGLAFLTTATSQAAPVTWGLPAPTTSTNDIDLSGTLVHAGSWGTIGDVSVTVGGETILLEDRPINTTDGEAGVTANGEFGVAFNFYTDDTGDTNFNAVLDSTAGGGTKILTLEGLVPGADYQVQLFVSDERGPEGPRTQKWSDDAVDGAGNESAPFRRDDKAFTLGTFTADTISQTIYGLPVNNPDTLLNAYILRKIADAAPGVYFLPASGAVTEGYDVGSYDIQTTTVPASDLTVAVAAPADLEVSLDGSSFFPGVNVTLDGVTPATVFFRAMDDATFEPTETVSLTHMITTGDGGSYPPLLLLDTFPVTVTDGIAANIGEFAVFSNEGAVPQTITDEAGAAPSVANIFTTTEASTLNGYQLEPGGAGIRLSPGKHLVLYNNRIDHVAGGNRAEMVTHLQLDSAGATNASAYGRAQGYVRNQNNGDEAVISGGTILDVTTPASILRLITARTDLNAAKSVQVEPDHTAIQLLKLDDGLDYLRVRQSVNVLADMGDDDGFTPVSYDTIDENSVGAMSFVAGTADVTLNQAGHYLVLANTYLKRTDSREFTGTPSANARVGFSQQVTINGTPVVGSRTTTYLRGTGNGEETDDGVTTIGIIIEAAAADVLRIEQSKEFGAFANIMGDKTGLAIVKLPDEGQFIRVEDVNGQDLNSNIVTAIDFLTQIEIDPLFTHDAFGAPNLIGVNADEPFLFLGGFFSDEDSTDRQVPNQQFAVNGTNTDYGESSQYSRNVEINDNGNWAGLLSWLAAGDMVEMTSVRMANGGILPGDAMGLQGAGVVSLTTNPVLLVNAGLLIHAGDTQTITANRLRTADVNSPATNLVYTLVSAPTGGTLFRGAIPLGITDTFTQDDIDNSQITFQAGVVSGTEFGFAFSVVDEGFTTAAGHFDILVAEVLVITDDTGTTDEDTAINMLTGPATSVFDNDTGDGLTVTAFDALSVNGAAVTVNPDGTFRYDPENSLTHQMLGTGDLDLLDSFTYTATDIIGDVATGTVTITVSPVDDPFEAVDNGFDDPALTETNALTFAANLVANDGIVKVNNGGTTEILVANYDASATLGLGVWENVGTLNGGVGDGDLALGAGVTLNPAVVSAMGGILAAYEFDGTTAAVAPMTFSGGGDSPQDFPGSIDLFSVSFEAWIKPSGVDLAQTSTVFETGGGTGSGIVLDNGVLRAANAIGVSEVSYDLVTDGQGVLGPAGATGEFFQVVFVIDLDNNLNALYVNGVLVASTNNPNTTDWDGGDSAGLGHFEGANHGGFQNGAAGTTYDTHYNGSIAAFRIYTKALSAPEVTQNHQVMVFGAVDLEADPLSISGVYDNTTNLVAGTGIPVTTPSGAIVTLNTVQGNFTYDPTGIPGITDLGAGYIFVDGFDLQVTDGIATTDNATIQVVIHGVNSANDDTLEATEGRVAQFAASLLVGNDQESIGAPNAFIDLDAETATSITDGTWVNTGLGGATYNGTLLNGNVITPESNFGGLGAAWDNPGVQLGSHDPISTTDFTLELWFKPELTSTTPEVLWEVGGNGNGSSVIYDPTLNQLVVRVDAGADTNTNLQMMAVANGVVFDEYNQLLVVYDRDNPGITDNLTLYLNNDPSAAFDPTIDGSDVNAGGGANDWAGADQSGVGLEVGSSALNQNPDPFRGEISVVRFFRRVLTPTEMALNFDNAVQPLQTVSAVSALGATITLNGDGSVSYDTTTLSTNIAFGVVVQDSFTYTINDGVGGFATGTVNVNVTGVGSLIAVDDAASVNEDGPAVVIQVLTNDLGAAGAGVVLGTVVANYRSDYQSNTVSGVPADFTDPSGYGWQYLWNAPVNWSTNGAFDASTGPLGSTNDYDLLVWEPAFDEWSVDDSGVRNDGPPGNWVTLRTPGGHPGPSATEAVGVSNTVERFAIAAYTVSTGGYYVINESFVTKPAEAADSVKVVVSVNTNEIFTTLTSHGATTSFDTPLGFLNAGDTIYVAAGPNGNQGSDTFQWDYDIVWLPAPSAEAVATVSQVTTDGVTITFDPAGQFDAIPFGFSIPETFVYTITNGTEWSSARVTVQIVGANDPPVSVDDTNTTDEDTAVPGDVSLNDTDIDVGDALFLGVSEVQGSNVNVGAATPTDNGGQVTVMPDGTYVYDPTGVFDGLSVGENAVDTFTYRAADALGLSATNTATVTITIAGAEDGVIAVSNTYFTSSSSPVSGNLITDDTGAGPDISIDTNDFLSLSAVITNGTLGLVTAAVPQFMGARGSVVLSNDTVVTVSFGAGRFSNAVVIAGPPTFNETEPTSIRVTNVDVVAGTFDIRLKEQPETGAAHDADGPLHAPETVSWIVLEEGLYTLPNGSRMEVGSVDTAAIREDAGPASWRAVAFTTPFDVTPAVFHFIQTGNGTPAEEAELYGTRMSGIATTNGFDVALEDYEGDSLVRTTTETIGWVAIEPGSGNWNGSLYEIGLTPTTVDEVLYTVNFANTYTGAPLFIASQETILGADPSQLRSANITPTSAGLYSREDTVNEAEVAHADERAAYLAIEGSGDLTAISGWTTMGGFTYDPNGAFDSLPVGNTATDTFTYVVRDAFGNVDSNTVSILIGSLSILEQWRLANGFAANGSGLNEGDEEDFDGDGLLNIHEFAFGTDPNIGDNQSLSVTTNATAFIPGDVTIRYVVAPESISGLFMRRVDYIAAGLTYTPEFSPDILSWTATTNLPAVFVPDDGSGYELMDIPATMFPTNLGTRGYFRISITYPDP